MQDMQATGCWEEGEEAFKRGFGYGRLAVVVVVVVVSCSVLVDIMGFASVMCKVHKREPIFCPPIIETHPW